MSTITIPSGVFDPASVLAAVEIPYAEVDGVPTVPDGMEAAALAALSADTPVSRYRIAAKRALRRHLRENIIGLIADDDRVAVASAALALINNRRARGQSLTADMLTIETMAVGLLQDKLAPLKELIDAEAAVDAMTDAREIYDLAARPESWSGWTA